MLKRYFSNKSKRLQQITALFIITTIAGLGFYLLSSSHAASPYASTTANSGNLANGAVQQTCSGASDGSCVTFNGTTPGGGGGSNMAVGLNAGGWGSSGAGDVSGAVNYVRLDQGLGSTTASDIGYYTKDNVKVDLDFSGDITNGGNYDTGGVSAINPTNWANEAVSWYKSNCTVSECPMIEVLNEPYGDWFWGANADDQQNADAYAVLTEDTYNAFHAQYGSSSPKILSNIFANGCGSGNAVGCSDAWWSSWISKDYSTIANYYDGVIMHPYGGTDISNPTQEAGGNRNAIISAHNATGKAVYVTEVGWPTDDSSATVAASNETGDSLQWPQADSSGNTDHGLDQCDNVYNFITWARGTGYVNAVMIFGYADYGTNDFYGMVNSSGSTHKPSYSALKDAGQNLPNPCPSPTNGYALQST